MLKATLIEEKSRAEGHCTGKYYMLGLLLNQILIISAIIPSVGCSWWFEYQKKFVWSAQMNRRTIQSLFQNEASPDISLFNRSFIPLNSTRLFSRTFETQTQRKKKVSYLYIVARRQTKYKNMFTKFLAIELDQKEQYQV